MSQRKVKDVLQDSILPLFPSSSRNWVPTYLITVNPAPENSLGRVREDVARARLDALKGQFSRAGSWKFRKDDQADQLFCTIYCMMYDNIKRAKLCKPGESIIDRDIDNCRSSGG
jgi:hypothetical protein